MLFGGRVTEMADCGSGSLESGSQNSSGGSGGDSALKKIKGPKVVKSRYMQYDKPKNTKNVTNTTVLSAGKSQEKGGSGTPTRKSVLPQKFKVPPGPKVVKSRYMQYDKPKNTKKNVTNTTVLSAGKSQEKGESGTPTRKSVLPQKFKVPPGLKEVKSRYMQFHKPKNTKKNVTNTTVLSAGKSQEKGGSGIPTRKSVLPQKFKVPPGPKVVKSRYMQYDKPKNTKKNVTNTTVLSAGKSQEKGGSGTPTRKSVLPQKFKVPPGPKVVKSRYMQYDKPKNTKKNVTNTTVLSAGKSQEKGGSGTPTRKSVLPQKFKVPPAATNTADGSFLCKDDLQSTLLDGHKIARPELDFSVINDKTLPKGTPKPLSASEQRKPKKETNVSPEEIIEMYESQTLLFTYLTVKMQKNIRRLEEKAERSLLLLHNEKTQLQENVQQLKRELLLTRREEQLDDLLENQAEFLAPSTATTTQFKDDYTSFATALDCTRHQLPIKDIHITGTRQRFLEDIQKHLSSTISLLEEATSSSATDNVDILATIKNLDDVVHKTEEELSRTLHQVMELSFKVDKDVALQSQKLVEDHTEVEVVKNWYFSQGSQEV
ncbi:HAUS augmin-like complex subunit 8 isoform X2 [Phyllobates terribilis]|uniref:HAUS augmin-like complex subunit 8 isoform X2 n=1 Tax=Phyllobates terribilis TaxID=111132 RepID=UPI003CCB65FC